jgi:acetyl-CoA carboxylase carboxyl transferase subunit alpha
MVVGHQRGRTTQERLKRNFGMPNPEGYRKALRLFHMAEKFKLPLINFIDTQGAYPGIEAEERGQAEAIATNLLALCELTVPIICIVIGEGGSGGALALGIGDKILMMENACYSVISPEGCASILFNKEKDFGTKNYAAIAADLLKPTATDLLKNSIIDEIIPEPMGGAHTNHKEAAELMRPFLIRSIDELSKLVVQDLVDRRYKKFRAMGPFTDH